MRKCGKGIDPDTLVQWQLGNADGWARGEGYAKCLCSRKHEGVHSGFQGATFVSWPWKDLGDGAGCWDDGYVSGDAAALWRTDRPVDDLASLR